MIARNFDGFDAMVFQRCNAVHTMFMGIRLDLVFVDAGNCVCAVREAVGPWRLMIREGGASTVIELPAGTVARCRIERGDVLDLNAETLGGLEHGVGGEKVVETIAFIESER